MSILKTMEQRRTYYSITKEIPVSEEQVLETIRRVTELTPDAFDMRSSRAIVALGEKNRVLWETIIDAFDNTIAPYKTECFRNSYGTILYFYDNAIVKELQEKHPIFSAHFPGWAMQASAMLQINMWNALEELGLGVSLHHYNPIINDKMRELFQLPEDYLLIAQMPFGGIKGEPRVKEPDDISKRVLIYR